MPADPAIKAAMGAAATCKTCQNFRANKRPPKGVGMCKVLKEPVYSGAPACCAYAAVEAAHDAR